MAGMKTLAAALLTLLLTAPAAAQAPPDAPATDAPATAPLRELLHGIDTIPTAAQLRAVPDVVARLVEAARDRSLGVYARGRAVSLLTIVGSPEALDALRGLAADEDVRVRAAAVYAVGRGFGEAAPDEALALLTAALDAGEPGVRQSAARGLAWVGRRAEARAALERRSAVEGDEGVRAAIRRAIQRTDQRRPAP